MVRLFEISEVGMYSVWYGIYIQISYVGEKAGFMFSSCTN